MTGSLRAKLTLSRSSGVPASPTTCGRSKQVTSDMASGHHIKIKTRSNALLRALLTGARGGHWSRSEKGHPLILCFLGSFLSLPASFLLQATSRMLMNDNMTLEEGSHIAVRKRQPRGEAEHKRDRAAVWNSACFVDKVVLSRCIHWNCNLGQGQGSCRDRAN